MPLSDLPRAHERSCGQSGESGCVSSVPMRIALPSLTSTLLKPLLPQSAQQLHGIHVPWSPCVSSAWATRLKPVHALVPSAALPAPATPTHLSRSRLVMVDGCWFMPPSCSCVLGSLARTLSCACASARPLMRAWPECMGAPLSCASGWRLFQFWGKACLRGTVRPGQSRVLRERGGVGGVAYSRNRSIWNNWRVRPRIPRALRTMAHGAVPAGGGRMRTASVNQCKGACREGACQDAVLQTQDWPGRSRAYP